MQNQIKDYTDEQLLEMSEAEVENLVQVELAYAGVTPVIEPVEPANPLPEAEKSAKGWKVTPQYSSNGLIFANSADAEIVAAMPLMGETCHYPHPESLDPHRGKTTIEPIVGMTSAEWAKVRDAAENYKVAKDRYDEQFKQWEDFHAVEKGVRDEITRRRFVEHERVDYLERATREFSRLSELARGDVLIARRFFYNAFRHEDVALAHVLGEVTDEDKAIAPPEQEKAEEAAAPDLTF